MTISASVTHTLDTPRIFGNYTPTNKSHGRQKGVTISQFTKAISYLPEEANWKT